MTTQDKNKLIAEFMDGEFDGREWVFNGQQHKTLKYETSWDWLMPVVEKIEKLAVDNIGEIYCVIMPFQIDIHGSGMVVLSKKRITTKINMVWIAIVDFIQWYNENRES